MYVNISVDRCYSTNMLEYQRYDDYPEFLTVEEAAQLLRVGRTKAYAMAREWRSSDGRSGLPVVDFGHVLRVPRRALDRLVDDALARPSDTSPAGPVQEPPAVVAAPARAPGPQRRPRHRARPVDQAGLFDPPKAS